MPPEHPDANVSAILAEFVTAWESGTPAPVMPDDPGVRQVIDEARRIWSSPGAPSDPAGKSSHNLLPDSIGRFRIIREVGRGGFGVVYEAHDPATARTVALKIPLLAAFLVPDTRIRFMREAEMTAALDHPNVVTTFEAGEAESTAYLATAFVSGPTLSEWLRQRTEPVDLSSVVALVAKIADGVHHAHSRGILHRDLKPANILLQPGESCQDHWQLSDYTPRVADFGLGRDISPDHRQSLSGQIVGTVAYMAPEQTMARPQAINVGTDVWALGVVLYELLTGRLPFRGEHQAAVMYEIVRSKPTAPRSLRPAISHDLEAICLKCLEKSSADRYASAEALANDLRRFLAGEPTIARPLTLAQTGWRWAKRRPVALTAALVAMLALIIGPTVAVRYWDMQRLLNESEKTNAATLRLAEERERSLLVQQIRTRLSDRPTGWIDANLSDFERLTSFPVNDEDRVALRSDLLATITENEWHEVQRLLPETLIESVAFAPDGKSFAIGSNLVGSDGYGTVTLFDAITLKKKRVWRHEQKPVPIAQNRAPGPDGTRSLLFRPDGRVLYQGTRSGWLLQYDLDHPGDEPRVAMQGHEGHINRMCISPGGSRVYTLGADGRLKQWNTASPYQELAARTFDRLKNLYSNRAIHHFGHQLVATAGDEFIATMNPESLEDELPKLLEGDTLPSEARLPGIALESSYSPESEAMLAVGPDVWLWDTRHRQPTTRLAGTRDPLIGNDLPYSPTLSPDGKTGAVLTDDELILWDVPTTRIYARRLMPPLSGISRRMTFSPDSRLLVVTGRPTLVLANRPSKVKKDLAVQGLPVRRFSISIEGTLATFASVVARNGYHGAVVKVWSANGAKPRVIHTVLNKFLGEDLALSPAAEHLLFMPDENAAACVQLPGAKSLWQSPCERLALAGQAHAFSADGRKLWAARGTTIECLDTLSGQRTHLIDVTRSGRGIHQVWAIAAGARYLLAANRDGVLDVFDNSDGNRLHSLALGEASLTTVAVNREESLAVVGAIDGRLVTFEPATGKVLHSFTKHTGRITTSALNPDGTLLGTGGADGRLHLWQWRDNQWDNICEIPTGKRSVAQVRFPANDQLYVLLTGAHGIQRYDLSLFRKRLERLTLAW